MALCVCASEMYFYTFHCVLDIAAPTEHPYT